MLRGFPLHRYRGFACSVALQADVPCAPPFVGSSCATASGADRRVGGFGGSGFCLPLTLGSACDRHHCRIHVFRCSVVESCEGFVSSSRRLFDQGLLLCFGVVRQSGGDQTELQESSGFGFFSDPLFTLLAGDRFAFGATERVAVRPDALPSLHADLAGGAFGSVAVDHLSS